MVYKFIFNLQLCWADISGSAAVSLDVAAAASAERSSVQEPIVTAEQVQIYPDTSSAKWPAGRGCKIISLPIFAKYTILRKQISQQRLFPPTENVSFEQRKESIGFKSMFES